MKHYSVYILTIFLTTSFLNAQTTTSPDGFWRTVSESDVPHQTRQLQPLAYQNVHLDFQAVSQYLNQQVPHESATSLKQSQTALYLPMPDGSFEAFRLIEYDAMESGLAAQFPSFKTYYGIHTQDEGHRVRIDITSKGLRVMGSHAEGQWFLDPYSANATDYYLVYDKKDYPAPSNWSCGVDERFHQTTAPIQSGSRVGDCELRVFRLALATTGEYTQYHGGVNSTMAELVNVVNRLNEVYERDVAVRFVLVDNNISIVFPNPSTDPYSGGTFQNLGQNVTTCNNVIGAANYDVGHIVSAGGGGGVAGLGVICQSDKARGATSLGNPVGDPFVIDYVAHELGHQFGGNHTQNNPCNRVGNAAYETGSAVTIMGYAGICAPNVANNSIAVFHPHSIDEIQFTLSNRNCPQILPLNNYHPEVDAGLDYTIPRSTPFVLTARAYDQDGNHLTYTWEQMNNEIASMPPSPNASQGPSFRSWLPADTNARTFPEMSAIVANQNPTWEVLPAVGRTMDFRVVVRDNAPGGGCATDDNMELTIASTSGPFEVLQPNGGNNWTAASYDSVYWNVANSNQVPVNCQYVDIFLSTDGGFTYPYTLATAQPNNGLARVLVPNALGGLARVRVQGHDQVFFDISNQNFMITPAPGGPGSLMYAHVDKTDLCMGDSVLVQIEGIGIQGGTGAIQLSAGALPAGLSVDFVSDSVNLTGTAYAYIKAAAGTTIGQYAIEILGQDPYGTVHNQQVFVNVVGNGLVGGPFLGNPLDGATGVDYQPDFSWGVVGSNGNYEFELATTPAFGASTIYSGILQVTDFAFPYSLKPGTVYYWRLRGHGDCGIGAWSDIRAFQTRVLACTVYDPAIVPTTIPANGMAIGVSNIADNVMIQDMNLINMDIRHDSLPALDIRFGIAGDEFYPMFANVCDPDSQLLLTLDDHAQDHINSCPHVTGASYRPFTSLSVFNDMSAQASWILEIHNSSSIPGSLESWQLEICADTHFVHMPPALLNLPLNVEQGDSAHLYNGVLQATSPVPDHELVYMLLSLPEHGILTYNASQVLDIGDQFTQEDINTGKILYKHDSTSTLDDVFLFDMVDGQGNWIQNETFLINVWNTDIEPLLNANLWKIYPNPAQDQVFIEQEDFDGRPFSIEILNIQGQILYTQDQLGALTEIDIQDWVNGLYMVRVQREGRQTVKKLLIYR